ncbi:MAG: PAS domain-containing protein [Stellaceae bacterium]
MSYDYRTDPILGQALAYWAGKRDRRTMPRRRDLDPAEIARLLPNLQLIDVQGDQFRYRLVGTALVEAFGYDYTGKTPHELFTGPRADFVCALYRSVRDGRRPMFNRNRYTTTKDLDLIANRLYLPLSEDDHQVNMIFGAFTFEFGADASVGAWGSADLDATMSETELVSLDAPVVSPGPPRR